MRSTLARAIIRVYPRPWRERYADELLALVESEPPRCRDLIDLAGGCASEWMHDPELRELVVLAAATTVVATPAMLMSEWLHADEWTGNNARWLTAMVTVIVWFSQATAFGSRRLYDWWRLRFRANAMSVSLTWTWRVALGAGTITYFEFMRFHFAPGVPVWVFLIGSPAHLFVLLDRFAARPWFPHPGRMNL